MDLQLLLLLPLILTIVFLPLFYLVWRLRSQRNQPWLNPRATPRMLALSDEQKQHMRQLRARNRDVLREVAVIAGEPAGRSDIRMGMWTTRWPEGEARKSGSRDETRRGSGHGHGVGRAGRRGERTQGESGQVIASRGTSAPVAGSPLRSQTMERDDVEAQNDAHEQAGRWV